MWLFARAGPADQHHIVGTVHEVNAVELTHPASVHYSDTDSR
jgi:uncharacterized protein YgiM (DUF1202 family)